MYIFRALQTSRVHALNLDERTAWRMNQLFETTAEKKLKKKTNKAQKGSGTYRVALSCTTELVSSMIFRWENRYIPVVLQ